MSVTTGGVTSTHSRRDDLEVLARAALIASGASFISIRAELARVSTEAHVGTVGDSATAWSAPLIHDGAVAGSLEAQFASEDVPARATAVLAAFASHAAIVAIRYPLAGRVLEPGALNEAAALTEGTSSADGLAGLTARVSDLGRSVIGSTRAVISLWDEERSLLKALKGGLGLTGPAIYAMGGRGTDMRSNSARVFRTGLPTLSNDASSDLGVIQSFVAIYDMRRYLSVPLTLGGRTIGVLHLFDKDEPFTLDDLASAELLAPWVSIAVALARSENSVRVQQRLEDLLSQAAHDIALAPRAETALLTAFESLAEVMCATAISLVPLGGSPIRWQCQTGVKLDGTQFFTDAEQNETITRLEFSHDPKDPGVASFHAPVHLAGERVATISLMRDRGVPFAPHEVRALSRLGSLAALALLSGRSQRQRVELIRLQERQRIADDLHDRVAQILFAAQLGLDSLMESSADLGEEESRRIAEVLALLKKGDAVIRDVIHELTPAPSSAVERLRAVILDVEEEFSAKIAVHVGSAAAQLLHGARRQSVEAVLKVTREASINALKHAEASHVSVRLAVDGGRSLRLTVSDDGRGLSEGDPMGHAAGYGVPSMYRSVLEARGELRFDPNHAGSGTRVVATLPA